MAHQQLSPGLFLGFGFGRLAQLPDLFVQLLQDLQQIIAPALAPRSQFQVAQKLQAFLGPQLALLLEPSFMAMCCNWFLTRVRICTSVCRCLSSCRRSSSSIEGTEIAGKRFSNSNCKICWASRLSVFCLRGLLARMAVASPIRNSCPNLASNRWNQR